MPALAAVFESQQTHFGRHPAKHRHLAPQPAKWRPPPTATSSCTSSIPTAPKGKAIESRTKRSTICAAFFKTLPDGQYRIYLVRTENNSHRLVIEVNVRRGHVIDMSDESEGTRDRPPDQRRQGQPAQPLNENPLLEAVPGGSASNMPNAPKPPNDQRHARRSETRVRGRHEHGGSRTKSEPATAVPDERLHWPAWAWSPQPGPGPKEWTMPCRGRRARLAAAPPGRPSRPLPAPNPSRQAIRHKLQ